MINKLLKMIFKKDFYLIENENKWIAFSIKQTTKEVTNARFSERK